MHLCAYYYAASQYMYVDAAYIATDGVTWSVCLFVTTMSPAKMAEPIDMPFRLWNRVDSGTMYLDGGSDPRGNGQF